MGSTVLVVSGSPILLQIVGAFAAACAATRCWWRRGFSPAARSGAACCPAADVVFADALAAPAVREARPRRLRELRLLGEKDLARVRKALSLAVPAA